MRNNHVMQRGILGTPEMKRKTALHLALALAGLLSVNAAIAQVATQTPQPK